MPQTSNKAASLLCWYFRFTRFGTTHLVRLQENEFSCGPSCAMMIHCRMNRLTTITDGMATEQSMISNVKNKVTGQAGWDPDTQGQTGAEVAELLNSFNIGTWQDADVGANGVTDAIVNSASFFKISSVPIIARVSGPGVSHWVMIDYMIKNPLSGNYWALVCDTWDSYVHVVKMTKGQAMNYDFSTPIGSWSFPPIWPDRTDSGTLQFDGEIVRCTGMPVTARLGKVFLGNGL
jgi:hypothetical protein